jgi:hypothetical protein
VKFEGSRCWRDVEVEEAKRTERRRERGVRRTIFMLNYRAVIQSVWKSLSRQRSGLALIKEKAAVGNVKEERLCLI